MNPQIEKRKSCILFKSIVDAAKELDKDQALELLLTYADYGLGETIDLDNCSKIVKLILMQNIEALNAADRRYQASKTNGPKGKENGGGVGRPRKEETPEEYQKRVEEWRRSKNPQETPKNPQVVSYTETPAKPQENPDNNPIKNPVIQKTPLECPQNPQKPLNVDAEVDVDVEVYVEDENDVYVEEEKDIDAYVDNDKDINLEEDKDIYVENKDTEYYLKSFLNNPTKDYSCLLNNITFFLQRNNSDLTDLQENLKKKCNCDMTIQEIVEVLQFMYKEKINFKTA